MKKLFLLITLTACLSACNNDLDTEGISGITYFPTFELTGGNIVLYHVGDVYAEPGIRVTEEGVEIPFTTSGEDEVDTSTPGLYDITYAAVNKDGFPGTAVRTVAVLEENLPNLDIEGVWTSNTNAFDGESLGQKMTITKLANGVYSASDSYAHPDLDIPMRFIINADGTATMEPQPASPFGVAMTGELYFNVPAEGPVTFPGGHVENTPVISDLAIAILLAPSSYRLKTWLKD